MKLWFYTFFSFACPNCHSKHQECMQVQEATLRLLFLHCPHARKERVLCRPNQWRNWGWEGITRRRLTLKITGHKRFDIYPVHNTYRGFWTITNNFLTLLKKRKNFKINEGGHFNRVLLQFSNVFLCYLGAWYILAQDCFDVC